MRVCKLNNDLGGVEGEGQQLSRKCIGWWGGGIFLNLNSEGRIEEQEGGRDR